MINGFKVSSPILALKFIYSKYRLYWTDMNRNNIHVTPNGVAFQYQM